MLAQRCNCFISWVLATIALAVILEPNSANGLIIQSDTNAYHIQSMVTNLYTVPHLSSRHPIPSLLRQQSRAQEGDLQLPDSSGSVPMDYVQMMRPVTILQAVGALVVGRLAVLASSISASAADGTMYRPLLWASASVYLSYGAGMVMNDVVDANMDAMHDEKNDRPVASGRISRWQGWMFCGLLCTLSVLFAHAASPSVSLISPFVLWTISNIVVMLGYAMGLQRLLVIKNVLCGWLAISPLVGANMLGGIGATRSLYLLAVAGFPLQMSREILKDAEDVEIDRGNKQTLPLVLGVEPSRRLAYSLVFGVLVGMILTPYYWAIFASKVPLYPVGVLVGSSMCVRASQLDLQDGQKLLKQSIYILLAGMIGSLSLQ